MKNYYRISQRILLFAGLSALTPVLGQTNGSVVKITYPQSRAVFQRDINNFTTLYLSGNYYQPVDSVQARVTAEVSGQGINTDWLTIQRNPQGGVFQGSLRAQGGWYQLEVRVFANGSAVGSDVLRKVGVGEVFIITGQSNAQGFQGFGAVGAQDDRVNCLAYDNTVANSLADPPIPTFQQLTADALIGPRGQSAWCWGRLGDLLAQQNNVPVLFINTAWQATVIKNWVESADGKITKNIFAIGTPNENFPPGMPYGNLITALRYYASLYGLRAILWQQGENDNVPLHSTREEYRGNMQYLINKTRSDIQYRYPAWVLARSSYNAGQVSQDIIQGQNDVINTYNNNVFPGPFTDNIQVPRYQGDVHFGNAPGNEGLNQLAQAWYQSLNPVFFASSRVVPPLPQPTLSVTCNATGSGLTLALPAAYKSYAWQSGQQTSTITATQTGTYQAVLKDANGNTYLSPTVNVQGTIQPPTPAITLASQPNQPAAAQQQICADSTLRLTVNTPASNRYVWTNGTSGQSITVGTSGTYSVTAVNAYGCRSAQASAVTLTVQPKLATPTVEQIGPYTLRAVLPTTTDGQTGQFDWRRDDALIPQNGPEVKVIINGNYTARAKTTFTLAGASPLTCYSVYSAPKPYVLDESAGGVSLYPNPSSDGAVFIETVENLENAEITVFTLKGQRLLQDVVPQFNQRKQLNLTGLAPGEYIVRIRSAGFSTSRRVIINR